MSASDRAVEKPGDEFAGFADIYDAWIATAPVTAHHVPFYVSEFTRAGGPCVELGVGNGRITIEAAKRGVDITGVDVSPAMLALTRGRAAAAGVADRIRLVEADFRSFHLPAPASLVALPFHTLGHMVTLDDKAALFSHVRDELAPGGRFVFDMFVFDPKYASDRASNAQLRAEFRDAATGDDVVLWEAVRYDMARQSMRVVVWTDRLDAEGGVKARRYLRMNFSWIDPSQVRERLVAAGFEIENCWGAFGRTPLTPESKTQIWIARRR
jgi:SAM-dependent methyltransferase